MFEALQRGRKELAIPPASAPPSPPSSGCAKFLCKAFLVKSVIVVGVCLILLPNPQKVEGPLQREQWNKRARCVSQAETTCDACSLPVSELLIPARESVAVVSGSTLVAEALKEKMEAASRTCVGENPLCLFGISPSLTDALADVALFNPRRVIFVVEHPLDAVSLVPEPQQVEAALDWTRRVHEVVAAGKQGRLVLIIPAERFEANPEAASLEALEFLRPAFVNGTLPPSTAARTCVSRAVVQRESRRWWAMPARRENIEKRLPQICEAIKPAFAVPFVRASWDASTFCL